MKKLINQLTPFVLFGIAIVAFAFGIMLLAYLFLFGALVGLVLFSINWLREKLFNRKKPVQSPSQKGRIIDSNDWRKLP